MNIKLIPNLKQAHYYLLKQSQQNANLKSVFLLYGPKGSGKTTAAMNAMGQRKHFYFSFKGLCGNICQKLLFAELQKHNIEPACNSFKDIFAALNDLAKTHRAFIFDDIDNMMSHKDFVEALNLYLHDQDCNPVFIIFISTNETSLNNLDIPFEAYQTSYLSIADIKKACPNRTGDEIVELFTLTGGIPEILAEFKNELSIKENLANLISTNSKFMNFPMDALAFHYRRTESYAFILHSLAIGNSKISEVGKFTNYPYNKCDKYIKSLIKTGFVQATVVNKKTEYKIVNSYFKIWFQHIYPNLSQIATAEFFNQEFDNMLRKIRKNDVRKFFIEACFKTLRQRFEVSLPLNYKEKLTYQPATIKFKNSSYAFDLIIKDKDNAIFVKIFHDENQSIGKEEYEKLTAAISSVHILYDSHIYIFAKRRFSDYLVHEASLGTLKLFNLDRLRY